jgi:type IV pilus assembly protein PilB
MAEGLDKVQLKKIIEVEASKSLEQVSVIDLVNWIITYSYLLRVSDIHIDPTATSLRIRGRIDGVMHILFEVNKELQDEIITRIKVLSGLRTDEHQIDQDGRFQVYIDGSDKSFDIRVSIMPTYYGENAVLRLLAEQGQAFTLEMLGFGERDLSVVKQATKKPYGMILSTGPTGSGKTTTLYTIIKMLNVESVSIVTLEDPIEYSLPGVAQVQVNQQTGLTFGRGLRAIMRQDPNIIMVGEIRDQETASIAVNASLTGHLILSTLHTNDAATALPRLLDMQVEPFLIASTVNVIIGQRLVRKICPDCRTERRLSISDLQALGTALPAELVKDIEKKAFYVGKGCESCDKSGYSGRIGIFEVLPITDAIREGIMRRFDSNKIKEIARDEGMTTMLEDGFNKALQGLTTIEEVLRVIHE